MQGKRGRPFQIALAHQQRDDSLLFIQSFKKHCLADKA